MSPEQRKAVRTAVKRVVAVADLRDKRTGDYAFGKVWGVFAILMICWWQSVVLLNGGDLSVIICCLVVAASVGPSMLDKFFSRISIVIGHQLVDSHVKVEETRREIQERRGGFDYEPSP